MRKAISIILTAVMVLGLLPVGLLWNEGLKTYASTGEVVLVNDHFDDGMIPEGWSEKLETSTTWEPAGTTGKVSVVDVDGNNCLRLELVDAKTQPNVRRTFTTAADDVIVSFAIRSSRDNINIPILIKDINENVISRMHFGKDKRIFLVTGFDESGGPILEDVLNTRIFKNTVYHIGFVINTKNNTHSVVIMHGNQTYTLKDKPLLTPADSVGALQVHQYYMYNNNGFIYLDDVRVEESTVNKMSLRLAVQNAQKVLADATVGTEIGFYPQTAVDAFQAEIDLANGVLESSTSTQDQVDQAIIDLNLAEDNFRRSKNPASATVNIDSSKGHAIPEGLSGANVRNVDQAWNYTSPEFKEGAATINPGFLRYFSGAVAKSLNMRTGLYEMEWVEMFRSGKEYGGQLASAKKTYVKGPQRLSDYYKKLLGPLGIKLVITINGFTDSPESAGAIAKFCKDNHIEVEMYQFCNEPYFFNISTNKNKFHFNNGLDYAKKMKPFADAIRAVDPDAKLTLSYSWDTGGRFRKEIAKYPNPYWDIVSIHSYAPYGPNDTDINVGMKKANAALTYSTSAEAMKNHFKVSWPDAPVMLTEFNVWNGALSNRMYSGIYLTEYIMRMSANPNILYVGMHSLSTKTFVPVNSYSDEMLHAYDTGTPLDVDSLTLGIEYLPGGLALKVLNDAVNHSTYTWDSTVEGGVDVDSYVRPVGGSMNKNKVVKMPALYAKAYKGDNGKNYLLVTNKSEIPHNVAVQVDNSNLTAAMTKTYIGHSDPAAKTGLAIMSEATDNPVHIPPYSVVRLEWDADTVPAPSAPRIYDFQIGNGEASLSWWKRETADSYTIKYGTAPDRLSNTSEAGGSVHSKTITGLEAGSTYYFAVTASNSAGESELSNIVSGKIAVPEAPEIVSVHPQDGKVTVIWNSVAGADTYNVRYGTSSGSHTSQADASNVCGFTVEGLTNDVPYYFVVTAGNGKGESAKSAELSATPKENVPVAPHALRAALKSGNKVKLTWTPYADKVLPETYEVRRSTQPYANDYVVLASDVSDTAYTDTLPEPGEYYYTVVTKNENGTSFYYSNVASVLNETSVPGEVTDISVIESNGSLRINWSDPSDADFASVKIFDGAQKVAEVAKGTQTVLLTGLTNGVEYTLTLKTVDQYANTSPGVNITGTPKSN